MPSPSTQKQLLSLPFTKGLSQKDDPRWLGQGALLTAQNTVHPKTNILEKRAGFVPLTRSFIPPNPATPSPSIVSGKRLGTDGSKLLAIGKDAWTDAAFEYDEASQKWIFVDRVPEAYVLPDRAVMSFDSVVREFDATVCNGYAIYVCSRRVSLTTSSAYYRVENAATGETIVATQVLPGMAFNGECFAPKVCVCGTNVVIGLFNVVSAQLFLYTLDCTQPWVGMSGPSTVSGLNNGGGFIASGFAWDIAPSTTSSSTFYMIYGVGSNGANNITLATYAATSPPSVSSTVVLNSGDIAYETSDAEPTISAFGLDVQGHLATVAYSYVALTSLTSSSLRVKVLQYDMNAATFTGTATDLMATPGPLNPIQSGAGQAVPLIVKPYTIIVAPVLPLQSAGYNAWRVAWSPGNSETAAIHPDTVPGAANGFIAAWTVLFEGGFTVVAPNQPRVTFGVALASRWLPNVNGIAYVLARIVSWEQGTYYLLADDAWQEFASGNTWADPLTGTAVVWYPMRLVATFSPRLSSSQFITAPTGLDAGHDFIPADNSMPMSLPHLVLNPSASGGAVYQALISVASTAQSQNPTLVQFDLASAIDHQNAVLGQNTGIAGGCPSATDGVRVHEFAFPYFPSIIAIGASSPVGSETYSYVAIYDWIDARGQIHLSGRSGAQSIVGLGANVVVTTMGLSAKEKALDAGGASTSPQTNGPLGRQVTIRLFRTQGNGQLYYEVASLPNTSGTATVVFTDNLSDASIATNPLLYGDGLNSGQQGAILDNLCPPAFQGLIIHQNRFFGVDGSNVWASKELTDGEGAGFNELSAFSWDEGPGPITALASFGDKLIIFKLDSIAYVTGQGPADDGSQNDWSPPLEIATDTGCIDWRSIVVKADGCYFDSLAGRRQLGFDLTVSPVPDVEDILEAQPVTTSAVLHPTAGRVLTSCNTDDVSVPRVGLMTDRDYILDSWMTLIPAGNNGAVSAVVADTPNGSAYHWLDASGVVWREQTATYFDGGSTYVPMQAETAWIKAEGIEGFARFRRLQVTWQAADPHALTLYVAYDFTPTYYLLGTVTWAMMTAMQNYPLCAQLFALPRQRAQAVRFKAVDAADAVTAPLTGQGPVLVSFGLEVSTYTNRRLNRLTAAQRT